MWIYLVAYPSVDAPIVDTRTTNTATTTAFLFGVYSTGAIKFYDGTETNLGGTIPTNQWTHIALVRNASNVVTPYINGTATGTTVSCTRNLTDNAFWIASYPGPVAAYLSAYLSNLRWVVGTAVYTSNFTPSTTPLTAITNTKLLTCQANRFVDSNTQTTPKTITPSGSPSVQAFSPFNPTASWSAATYGGSGYFDGSADWLNYTNTDNFGTSAFTVQAWVWFSATASNDSAFIDGRPTGGSSTGYLMAVRNSNKVLRFASAAAYDGVTPLVANTWNHVAATYTGGTLRLYLNGNLDATFTGLSFNFTDTNFVIGKAHFASGEWTGYISGLQLIKGTALYTSSTYTIPTSPPTAVSGTSLLLNFTNAGIYDATSKNDLETVGNAQVSTTQSKWGGSSMSFDGTGDYLLAPVDANPYYNFGTGDFTVECWFYANSLSATDYAALLGCNNAGAGNNEWAAYVRSNGIFFYGSSGTLTGVAGTINTGTWYHYAASRSGNTLRIFLNGTQTTSATVTGSYTNSAVGLRVGDDPVGSNPAFNGYLQDVRITKGYARYTANFTAPTAAFPTL
jgi:hypothetical protein